MLSFPGKRSRDFKSKFLRKGLPWQVSRPEAQWSLQRDRVTQWIKKKENLPMSRDHGQYLPCSPLYPTHLVHV